MSRLDLDVQLETVHGEFDAGEAEPLDLPPGPPEPVEADEPEVCRHGGRLPGPCAQCDADDTICEHGLVHSACTQCSGQTQDAETAAAAAEEEEEKNDSVDCRCRMNESRRGRPKLRG